MRPQSLLWASLVAAAFTLSTIASSYANIMISVDKSTQHMQVSVDGEALYDWPVSTGRPGYDTPSGTYRPQWMARMHYSKKYENAPMPHSIFFVHGDAIHGFTDTPFGVAAVSHGCVRLPLADAATLFNLVKQQGMASTTIHVYGHIPNHGGYYAQRQYRAGSYSPPPRFPFFFLPFFSRPDSNGQAASEAPYRGRHPN
jgi:hypothetical protein